MPTKDIQTKCPLCFGQILDWKHIFPKMRLDTTLQKPNLEESSSTGSNETVGKESVCQGWWLPWWVPGRIYTDGKHFPHATGSNRVFDVYLNGNSFLSTLPWVKAGPLELRSILLFWPSNRHPCLIRILCKICARHEWRVCCKASNANNPVWSCSPKISWQNCPTPLLLSGSLFSCCFNCDLYFSIIPDLNVNC